MDPYYATSKFMKQLSKKIIRPILLLGLVLILLGSCTRHYTPKPRGFFRIELPERVAGAYEAACPFRFEFPKYGQILRDTDAKAEPCWLNIDLKSLNGRIHLSYKPVHGNLSDLIEDARTLAYKHTAKADAINETVIVRNNDRVYGILYDIKGNAASSVQFFLTDSLHHFVRGALYFETSPRADSLAPVIAFVREDMVNLMNSLQWK
jgi:gliding motility-associated lipoprotein GldD